MIKTLSRLQERITAEARLGVVPKQKDKKDIAGEYYFNNKYGYADNLKACKKAEKTVEKIEQLKSTLMLELIDKQFKNLDISLKESLQKEAKALGIEEYKETDIRKYNETVSKNIIKKYKELINNSSTSDTKKQVYKQKISEINSKLNFDHRKEIVKKQFEKTFFGIDENGEKVKSSKTKRDKVNEMSETLDFLKDAGELYPDRGVEEFIKLSLNETNIETMSKGKDGDIYTMLVANNTNAILLKQYNRLKNKTDITEGEKRIIERLEEQTTQGTKYNNTNSSEKSVENILDIAASGTSPNKNNAYNDARIINSTIRP